MSFPTKNERQACWDSRDRYWECLDNNGNEVEHCKKLRQLYEISCPIQWTWIDVGTTGFPSSY
ncbi:cytochrome c oxidase assembly factor 6 homolog [Lycorma delicatula]|uniref:cytochrome c oxidase assembly factor 6 homolog n=1 Tax=Lycorma delicatula TaxID=130591 RepID=UPI003F50E3CA